MVIVVHHNKAIKRRISRSPRCFFSCAPSRSSSSSDLGGEIAQEKRHESHDRGDEWSLRAFESMRALRFFNLRARAEIKNLLASSEQFRGYNSRTASTSYIFSLQQSIWKSFSLK